MSTDNQLGMYGKLPSYGDFIHRNLPTNFMIAWDEWLQLYIAGSKEKIGEHWLDIYLTSPIWRFALSSGIIDEHHWVGVVLPSVDQVGRYYPFSILMPLPASTNPLEFCAENKAWYAYLEELALLALDGQLSLEELAQNTKHLQYLKLARYSKTGQPNHTGIYKVDFDYGEESLEQGYAHLLDSILTSQRQSYSVWSTVGSENIQPCLFTIPGLPAVSHLAAMMDGHWQHWGWPQTYVNNDKIGHLQ